MDLLPFCESYLMALSGGQKQRLAVVCGTLSDRRLLILDEPTSGHDGVLYSVPLSDILTFVIAAWLIVRTYGSHCFSRGARR